jgi:iron complex outermembrane recepter protein
MGYAHLGGVFCSGSTLLLGLASAGMVRAQDTADIPEIVVTANKREEAISKVGLAVTALSADELKAQRITSLSELANSIPGLSYTPSATQTPVYTLRGVGFYETTLAAYPATSVYTDQVPLAFPAMSTHTNFDLERVEVLKGPQGTLFGQNSTGGAINFVTAKPTADFEAGGDLSAGRFERFEGNGYVSGPLLDLVTARFAFTAAKADDWQYSYTRNDTLGKTNYFAARALLDWKPSDRLSFELNLTGWRDRSDPQAPQYQTLLSQAPAYTSPALRVYPFAPFNDRAADWNPQTRPHADNHLLQPSLRAGWEVTRGVMITSLTSYGDYWQADGFENDGTTVRDVDFYRDDGIIHSFNQELRISNTGATADRWVVGANYEKSHVYEENYNDFSQASTSAIYGYSGNINSTDQHMRNVAVFANNEYDLNEQFTFKAGTRYTDALRTADTCTRDPGDDTFAPVLVGLSNAIQFGYVPVAGFTPTYKPVLPIGNGCAPLDNIPLDGHPPTYLPAEYVGRLDEDNVSWRTGLDYKPSDNLLLYGNVAKGYKAGSYPIAPAATLKQFEPVTQESLQSYEVGFKLNALDRSLQVTGAAFFYDYRNKQLRAKYLDPIFGTLDTLVNIPRSRTIGGEFDVLYHPIPDLALGSSGSILGSKITEYEGLDTAGRPFNFANSAIPYTPKFQGRFTADYTWHVGSVAPFAGFTVSARSKAFTNIGGGNSIVRTPDFASSVPVADTFTIPGYTLVDLRAGLALDDGKWSVTVFGKNVFNRYYLTNIYTDYDTIDRFSGQPGTFGVTVAGKFR